MVLMGDVIEFILVLMFYLEMALKTISNLSIKAFQIYVLIVDDAVKNQLFQLKPFKIMFYS